MDRKQVLTQEQKKYYLDHQGTRCPFCKTDNITAESMQSDCDSAWCKVFCEECLKDWIDVYKLIDVESYA